MSDLKPSLDRLEPHRDPADRQRLALSPVEQQLLAERDGLDRALARFERLHAFTLRALGVRGSAALSGATAEGVVDVVESEVGLVWHIDAERLTLERAAAGTPLSDDALGELGAWALRLLSDSPGEDTRLLERESLTGLDGSLALVDALVAGGRSADGALLVVVLAGNTARSARFHEPLALEHVDALTMLAQQAAALIEHHRAVEGARATA
jgi:hypothetical protein